MDEHLDGDHPLDSAPQVKGQEQLADAILELIGWRRFTDQPPNDGQRVLIKGLGKIDEESIFSVKAGFCGRFTEDVIWWMPYPETPRVEHIKA